MSHPLEALRALGPGEEAPEASKQRVQTAMFATLAASAALTLPKTASVAPAATPLLGGIIGSKAIAVAMGIWLVGGATGAVLYRALHEPEVRVVYVDRPVLAPAPVIATAEPVLPPLVSAETPRAARPVPTISGSDLSRERALLDLARAHAARGESELVLKRVAQHTQQFPRGRLSEEREALAIRALQTLGRTSEAQARISAFKIAYPRSFLIPVLDSAQSKP